MKTLFSFPFCLITNWNNFYLGIGAIILFAAGIIIEAKLSERQRKRREAGRKWNTKFKWLRRK
jgi:hypothetical protein